MVKFQWGGVVLKFDVFRHCYAFFFVFFFAVYMQATTHYVANVLSRQAVKLVVAGPGFI